MTNSAPLVALRDNRLGSIAHGFAIRMRLTGRATGALVTAVVDSLLLTTWLTAVAVSPLAMCAPLLLPVSALMRVVCNHERRWISHFSGRAVAQPYRRLAGSPLRRAWTALSDPASWRDATWLAWHSVVGWTSAALSVSFLLGSVFYLAYPLLYAVTPTPVFRDPFGPWSHLSSTAQACALMPLAVLCVALWYATALPLARAEVAVGRALLGRGEN